MKKILLACMSIGLLSSCSDVMTTGMLYTNVTTPAGVTSAPGNKVGKSSCVSVLGLVAIGDASIKAAKINGRINAVSSVDSQKQVLLMGLIARTTTIITGN